MSSNIVIYSRDNCSYCTKAISLLDSKNIKYTVKKITEGPEMMREFLLKTKGAKTVPQIIINDKLIGGFDNLLKLDNENKLMEML